jgi:hypothetical protein
MEQKWNATDFSDRTTKSLTQRRRDLLARRKRDSSSFLKKYPRALESRMGEMKTILETAENMRGGVAHLESAAHLDLTVICGAIPSQLG